MLIGLVPALQATSSSLNEQIKSGSHATQAHERKRWLPRVLMSCEVALALMLVVGAGLLAASLVRLYGSGAGFDPRGVENIAFSMDNQKMEPDALMQFYRTMGEGLSRLPGVQAVSFARLIPLTQEVWDQDLAAPGKPSHDIDLNSVAPNYFAAMRIPLIEGRDFSWNDSPTADKKIILNQASAKLLFPGAGSAGENGDGDRRRQEVSQVVVGVARM